MSATFALVCHETQKRVWIGQGIGNMSNFYWAMPSVMNALAEFLRDHKDLPLFFVCQDHHDEVFAYEDYGSHEVGL